MIFFFFFEIMGVADPYASVLLRALHNRLRYSREKYYNGKP